MPGELTLIAVIGFVQAVVILVVGARLNGKVNRVESDTKAAREQLVNGHSTNMREEADERHSENRDLLHRLVGEVERMRFSIGRIWERLDGHTDSIHQLELSQPRSRFQPPIPRHRKEHE